MEMDLNVTSIIEHCNDMIMVTRLPDDTTEWPEILYCNPACCQMLGYEAHELAGRSLSLLFTQLDPAIRQDLSKMLQQQQPIREELPALHRNGDPCWLDLQIIPLTNSAGEHAFLSVIGRDITAQQQLQHALCELTIIDSVTQIYNRRFFMQTGESMLSDFHRFKSEFSVILFDINDFDRLSDTFGQTHCNRLLKLTSETCLSILRENDIFAHIAENEFAIILKHSSVITPIQVTTRLSRAIRKIEFNVEELQWRAAASFGVAQVQPSDKTFSDMLNRADQARYISKSASDNSPISFKRNKAF